jgi:hypothetical protein
MIVKRGITNDEWELRNKEEIFGNENWKLKVESWKLSIKYIQCEMFKVEDWGMRDGEWGLIEDLVSEENWKLGIESWELKVGNWKASSDKWQVTGNGIGWQVTRIKYWRSKVTSLESIEGREMRKNKW